MSILPRHKGYKWAGPRCYACCQENCAHGPCHCDCHRCKECGAIGDHYCPGSTGRQFEELIEAFKPTRCKQHPRYRGVGKPRLPCETCWRIYIKEHP